MRDAEGSDNETEKSWKSEDEAFDSQNQPPAGREWRQDRHFGQEQTRQRSAGRGMAAVLPSHVHASNPSLAPAAHGQKPMTQPESEPSKDDSESETSSPPEPADPAPDPADPWGREDPWARGRDPWSTGGRQDQRRQDPPTATAQQAKAPAPQPADPWAGGQDPWANGQDPWANGSDPWANGPSAGMSSVSPDPWQADSDPWSRQDAGAKGYQGKKGQDRFNMPAGGKGTEAAQRPAWQEGQDAKGWPGAKGQKGSGPVGKSKADPLFENDPWAEAAGKGRSPGKGAQQNGYTDNGARSSAPMPYPEQRGRAPESPFSVPPRRDTPYAEPPAPQPPPQRPKAEPVRPKPAPPRPPSSDGDESQFSQGKSSQSGVGRFRRAGAAGAAGAMPERQKTDFLDYKARSLQLGFGATRCCQIEVRANKQVNMPGFLRCEKEEILLLRFVRDGFALLEDFPSKAGKRTGWVPLEFLKPVEPYDFYVKVMKKPGVRIGLLGEELDFADGVGRILVVRVEEPSDGNNCDTLLSSWNERCQQCFTRDQLLPGDLITCVNGRTSLKEMLHEIQDSPPNTVLKLQILRHEPTMSPVWESLAGHGLGHHAFEQPARPPPPQYDEIDQFQ